MKFFHNERHQVALKRLKLAPTACMFWISRNKSTWLNKISLFLSVFYVRLSSILKVDLSNAMSRAHTHKVSEPFCRESCFADLWQSVLATMRFSTWFYYPWPLLVPIFKWSSRPVAVFYTLKKCKWESPEVEGASGDRRNKQTVIWVCTSDNVSILTDNVLRYCSYLKFGERWVSEGDLKFKSMLNWRSPD